MAEVNLETGEVIEKPKFRNHDNFKLGDFVKDMEVNNEPSMTIPDESFTIKEILEKYTRGVLPDIMKKGDYDDVEDFDGNEIENPVDITEVEEELTKVNERIQFSASVSGKAKKSEATTTKEEEASVKKPDAKEAEK